MISNEADDEAVHAIIRDNPGLRAAGITDRLGWQGEDIRRLDKALQRVKRRNMIEARRGGYWYANGIDAKPRES